MPAIVTVRAMDRDVEVKAFDAVTGDMVPGYGGVVEKGVLREFQADGAVDLRVHEIPEAGDSVLREAFPAEADEPTLPAITYMGERRNWVFVETGEALTPADVDKYVKHGVIRTN